MDAPPAPPLFTILLPIHRPPDLLGLALHSVLAQREQSFEIFIVCDGAPDETAQEALRLASTDTRVHARVFPKGERHGELHRAEVIETESRGRYICHICDDDLWMPGFLTDMARLLDEVEFGNLLQVAVKPEGGFRIIGFDLGSPEVRARMVNTRWNFFGPSVCGYRRTAYERLSTGWSPAPDDLPTDLFMWRKFLRLDDTTFATRHEIGALSPRAPRRQHMTIAERAAENRALLDRMGDTSRCDALIQEIRRDTANDYFRLRFPG
ncbi:MAG: glycosyltransferase family 2 protein [Pseudomonadota bacterium]